MLIFQGDADILGPDTIEFARKAARAGVDVRLRVEPGGFHVYVLSVPFIPELRPETWTRLMVVVMRLAVGPDPGILLGSGP